MTELYHHRARKRFGQNFLHDAGVIHRILRAIHGRPGERLLEIGPGQGALTEGLLGSGARLDVIELDQDLIPLLRLKFGLNPLFTLHQGDAMKYDLSSIAAGDRLRVVGNLPYNISTPILFHLLEHVQAIEDQHFMLQKEVIDRMVAAPATAAYGRLSVMLQWRYAMEDVLFVPPESFDPPPRVDSAVVRMVPRAEPAAVQPALLEELVQVAFSQRRKLLRHTLGRWLEARQFAGTFDTQRRAEEVPVADYVALAQACV